MQKLYQEQGIEVVIKLPKRKRQVSFICGPEPKRKPICATKLDHKGKDHEF